MRDVIGFNFCCNIVQVDQFGFFFALLGSITFPVVASRFLKPIPLNKLWVQSFPNFKTLRLLLSPCSIKAFAIAIEKVTYPPLERKVMIYFLTFSSMSFPRSSGLPRCKLTINFSGDLFLFSASFKDFFRNPRTVLSFKSGNSDLNFCTTPLQPVSLGFFAI